MEEIFGFLILILIIFLIFSGTRKLLFSFFKLRNSRKEFLNLTINKEDTTGQIFIILSIIFFGESLLILNRYLLWELSVNWVIFIVSLIFFLLGYILEALYPIIFGILLLPIWWVSQSVLWVEKYGIHSNTILSGIYFILLIFYLSGRILENNKKWEKTGTIINLLSIPFLFTFLFILSTPYGISLIEGNLGTSKIILSKQLTFFLLLFLFSSIILLVYSVSKNFISLSLEFIPFFFLLCFFLSFILFKIPTLTYMDYEFKRSFIESFTGLGIFFVIFLNILTFSFLLLLFFIGYHRKEEILINFGVLFMSFFIIFQYFSFFKFLNKSLFFFIGGILLFLIGYFMEKGRKKYIEKIKEIK